MNRYSNILYISNKFAAIAHPPQQLFPFLKTFLNKINSVETEVKKLAEPFLSSKEDALYWGYDFLHNRNFFNDLKSITDFDFREMNSLKRDIDFYISWKPNDSKEEYDKAYGLRSIISSMIKFSLPEIKRFFELRLKRFLSEDDEISLKEKINSPYNSREDFNYGPIKFDDYKNIIEIKLLIEKFIDTLSYVESKLKEQERRTYNADKPPSENVELLYHTTINSNDIESNGFRSSWNDNEGLGGSNTTNSGLVGVSFTSSFYVAKEILRCLKEAILIAHGEVKKHHILEWANGSGIKESVIELYKSLYGYRHFNDDFDWTEKNVFNLYRCYLAEAEHSTSLDFIKRYDPLFMSGDESFMNLLKNKSISDVGIIVAECDMTDPDIGYFPGMHEYRVPVRSIKRIAKVIR